MCITKVNQMSSDIRSDKINKIDQRVKFLGYQTYIGTSIRHILDKHENNYLSSLAQSKKGKYTNKKK